MGNVGQPELEDVISALESVLQDAGFDLQPGNGLKALQEVFAKNQ
jgi:aspartate aminotransferase-like enzyme